MSNRMYVNYDNQYHRPRKRRGNGGFTALVALTLVLVISVIGVFLYSIFSGNDSPDSNASGTGGSVSVSDTNASVIVNTLTPAAEPTLAPSQNSVIFPATAQMNVPMGTPASGLSAAERGVDESVFLGDSKVDAFVRTPALTFGDPLNYQSVAGVLTFRGNNFRNCASFGTVPTGTTTLEQAWEYNGVGSMSSSSWAFSWSGTGWTGQPLIIQWDWDVQQTMNLYPEKKAKKGLTEVIQATMDGNVYFFDLDDGTKTRDPLHVGFTIKGTPAVDPRGYPILYLGQGDNNGSDKQVGFRIFSLIDFKQLYYQNGLDSRAFRTTWGACDSSPIINAATDTLIYPNENGMIYTIKLNTQYDKATGQLSINPENYAYRYLLNGISGSDIGIESSMSIYDHYGYCSDNSGNLICVDLNTLKLIWAKQLDDDSDVTPVIEEDNGRVYLYCGTEVDWQRSDVLNYMGASYTYKIDAMTGDVIWRTSSDCYTKNGEDKGDDVNGGMLGTPIVGKKSISNLVIFSYCMTKGLYSGNRLVAYDKTTGEQVWDYEMNCYSWSSPVDVYDADGNAYIIICDSNGQIHLVDGKTGTRIMYLQTIRNKGTANETKQGLNMESSPAVFNDMLVIGTRAGSVFGVRIK